MRASSKDGGHWSHPGNTYIIVFAMIKHSGNTNTISFTMNSVVFTTV